MNDLADTRTRGYAIGDGKHVPGSRCAAAPIFDAGNEFIELTEPIGVSRPKLESC